MLDKCAWVQKVASLGKANDKSHFLRQSRASKAPVGRPRDSTSWRLRVLLNAAVRA